MQFATRAFCCFHCTLDMNYAFTSFYRKDTDLGAMWNAETQSSPLRARSLKGKIRNVYKWSFIVNIGSSLPKHCKSAKKRRYCVPLGQVGRCPMGANAAVCLRKWSESQPCGCGTAVLLHRGNGIYGDTE